MTVHIYPTLVIKYCTLLVVLIFYVDDWDVDDDYFDVDDGDCDAHDDGDFDYDDYDPHVHMVSVAIRTMMIVMLMLLIVMLIIVIMMLMMISMMLMLTGMLLMSAHLYVKNGCDAAVSVLNPEYHANIAASLKRRHPELSYQPRSLYVHCTV